VHPPPAGPGFVLRSLRAGPGFVLRSLRAGPGFVLRSLRAGPATAAFIALALLGAAACSGGEPPAASSSRVQVAAAFYPLAWVAERVGGGNADVIDLTPQGAEPHDVELTSDQVVAVTQADVMFYLGGGFQPAVEELASGMGEGAVDVLGSEGVEFVGEDPHVWLDPLRMLGIVEVVAGRLAALDQGRAAAYKTKAASLTRDLEALDADFRAVLGHCQGRELVTSHEAFGYLAESYGLVQVGIAGIDSAAEPSPQRLAEVARFVDEHDVATVFFERLLSPRIAQTIAEETGAATAVLDPLESRPQAGDYTAAMRLNLVALEEGLGCR